MTQIDRATVASQALEIIRKDDPLSPFYQAGDSQMKKDAIRQLGFHVNPNVTHGMYLEKKRSETAIEAGFYWLTSVGWRSVRAEVNSETGQILSMRLGRDYADSQSP